MSDGEITLKAPDRKTKGYLRRLIAVSELQAELAELQTQPAQADGANAAGNLRRMVTVMERMADMLADFVVVSNGTSPREALLNLNQEDFEKAFAALRGEAPADPLEQVGPASGDGSAAG